MSGVAFPMLCRVAGLPEPVAEYQFHPSRRWRFDWAFPQQRIALEIEGGAFVQGRHTRGSGFVRDLEKYSEAAALGWRIVRAVPRDVENGAVLDVLGRALRWDVERVSG